MKPIKASKYEFDKASSLQKYYQTHPINSLSSAKTKYNRRYKSSQKN